MIRHAIFPLTMFLLLSGCKENADTFEYTGYQAQYMFCFKDEDLNLRETRISFINPQGGSLGLSGELYDGMIEKVGTRSVYPESSLVFEGRQIFVGLERTKDKLLVWEFPVGRNDKAADWSDWQAPTFTMVGEFAKDALLAGRATKLPAPKGTDIWFRYRIVKYNRSPPRGVIPMCPGDAG